MGLYLLLLVLHVVVVGAIVAGRALHTVLGPVAAETAGTAAVSSGGQAAGFPSGPFIEEYVQGGLADLRIMLVQAARRRHD